ncbi:simple sugar transport system substrate-binding protein [Thermomonospora echinospora]|uniref:Simple sugar transport system substrate-binding protein n=1 Tax=Thermomonospora echinospora TaxID=1992 RepID=A0A1H6E1S9_9ACTN|nr:substrate-binding domain-containing protein [Thermomonospora echinospora]SEG91532.1 simple sugar transport system substrate-binding protein [Thermomonospora echinospora]
MYSGFSRKAVLAGAAAGLLALAGCSNTGASEGDTGGAGKLTACVTTLFPTGTFAEFVTALKSQGEKRNMSFDVQHVNNDSSKENQVLSACATRQVDVVIASVVSPTGSVASLQRLESADIPVICYNTCLNPPQDQQLAAAFVTNDQVELGERAAEAATGYIKEKLGGTAKVAYLTCETYDVCKQRRQGLDKGLAGVNATVVAAQEGFVVDKATPVATSILTAHPDVDVFIAENEDGVIAAANAIKARGLTGRTVVFGIGMNPTVAGLLLAPDGVVQGTIGQDAASWATEVVEIADAIRNGRDTGPFHHYTPGPGFSHDDPGPVRQYLQTQSG